MGQVRCVLLTVYTNNIAEICIEPNNELLKITEHITNNKYIFLNKYNLHILLTYFRVIKNELLI